MKQAVGVCLGASSVSYVKIEAAADGNICIIDSLTLPHNGDPKNVFRNNLNRFNPDMLPVAVTGRKFRNLVKLPVISEPEAVELAYEQVRLNSEHAYVFTNDNEQDPKGKKKSLSFSAIASLGGETFMVYTLDSFGKISNIISKNQCASGTGEFFLQQIKRMNLELNEVEEIPNEVDPYKVSGRCSVFCKSDCTHALNKGTPKHEVTAGLAKMMAEKVEELLRKVPKGRIMLVGGVTRNKLVMNFITKKFKNIFIPEVAPCFEALGAAIFAINNNIEKIKSFDDIFIKKDSSFVFHEPLSKFKSKVNFKSLDNAKAADGDKCILGLDVGSTTTKAVIIRISDNLILGSVYLYTHGNPIGAARKCYQGLLDQIPQKIQIVGLGTTGSGRHIAGLHALTDGVFNEIVAHATAAVHFDPEVDTIFEIGGQDAKYTYIVNKVPADYAMNEACSAGTGSFIEEAAYESLGVSVKEIEGIALKGEKPPNFSDQCAAFINSDIKTALHENISKENIVAGLVYSICLNYVNRVKGNRQVGNKIFMQGGVCYNKAIPIAMAALTGKEIIVPPEPGLMGAYGVALEVKEKLELGLMHEKCFDLAELASREVEYKTPFICRGGKEKCDLACSINLINVQGKNYPFGGACNKYYNLLNNTDIDIESFDLVGRRHEVVFKKFAPATELPDNAPTVGINQTFHTFTIFPLYYNFFAKLGFRVVLSDKVEEEGLERETASFCYPCQLSLGLFQDLLNKNPDYYFIPEILEMYVNDEENHRKDFNCTCAFLNCEPLYLKQIFRDYHLDGNFIMPILDFSRGFGTQAQKFIDAAKLMGITDNTRIREAYDYAVRMQEECQKELFSLGQEFLEELESNPDNLAMVIIGRPYNSYTEIANKGIPRKIASRGIYAVPYDFFDYREEIIDDNQYWEGSKKILKAAKIVKRHPQMFGVYVSNFSCAPDSMTITTFRTLMGTKPSLTLELDGHTADAGINTRIDAAVDIIKNFKKLQDQVRDPDYSDFTPAKVVMENDAGFFISSEGEKIPLKDERVVMLIPSMGDISARLFAAAMRGLGINAENLPEGNTTILKYGRANSTGKECLPLILIAGSLMDYIENRWDGKKYIVLFVAQGAGDCRLGQYPVFLRDMILKNRLKNVVPLPLSNEDGFAGLGPMISVRGIQALLTSDVLDDIRSAIMANSVDPDKGLEIFESEIKRLCHIMESTPKTLFKELKQTSRTFKTKIPVKTPIEESKYIALVGEIYVRRDHFSHKWLNRQFAKKGFVVKDAYISEWIFYVDYLLKKNMLEPMKSLHMKYERLVRKFYMLYAERRVKRILARSDYYQYSKIDIDTLINHSKHIIPVAYKGEPGLTLGVGLHETIEKYCGVINLGPFGCMPTRFSEAVTTPLMKIENKIEAMQMNDPSYTLPEIFNGNMNIPFLTIETDGNVYPQLIEARLEMFTLQAERMYQLMKQAGFVG